MDGGPAEDFDLLAADAFKQFLASLDVHGLGEAVAHGLEYQGMVRYLNIPGHGIVLTCYLGWEDGGEEVV